MSGQLWAVNALGGYMYSDELSNVMRTALQPIVRFRQLCDAKDATDKGLGAGELFNWNVYSDVEGFKSIPFAKIGHSGSAHHHRVWQQRAV